jgi:DNA-binding phage protein
MITLEVADDGIEQAKGYMEEAMKTGNLKEMIAQLTGAGNRSGSGNG